MDNHKNIRLSSSVRDEADEVTEDNDRCQTGTCQTTELQEQHSCSCRDNHNTEPGITHNFLIKGLDCAECVRSLEKSLLDIPGVRAVHIFFASGKVTINFGDIRILDKIYKTVTGMGYQLESQENLETLLIAVPEMDCIEEVRIIRKKLEQKKGILNLEFFTIDRKLRLIIDRTLINPTDIIKDVKDLGMTPSLIGETGVKKETAPGRSPVPLVIAGALLLLAQAFSVLPILAPFSPYLFSLSIIIGGFIAFKRAFFSLKQKTYDMNVLMTIAIIGAAFLQEWLEAAIVVFLFALAQLLESRSLDRARKAIENLMDQAPDTALVKIEHDWKEIPSAEVQVGDIIRIKPGEKIPLDGIVIEGQSTINQAPITGESLPIQKTPGDTVFAGTVNEKGSLDVRVTHEVRDTTLARIVHMVEESQAKRAPAQAFIDRFAGYYTPAVMITALLVVLIPVLFFQADLAAMIYRALVILLISCPCALVISTPVSILSGLSRAAGNGVLIKGGIHLENFAEIKALVFDKTGTLTRGEPEVQEVIRLNNLSENDIIALAAAVELHSEHPIAEAVVKLAREKEIAIPESHHFRSMTGLGAKASINNTDYYVGSHRYFCTGKRCEPNAHALITTQEKMGKTVAVLGNEEELIGILVIADTLREEAEKTIREIRESGIDSLMMLTGDHSETAKTIAEQLGIDYRAELLPHEKVDELEKLKAEKQKIAMVGDGINDAPALAAATVGVAMGAAGSDTALEVADVALLADDLSKLPFTLKLARKTLQIIKQNIAIALSLKALFLILAIQGTATLWMAIAADMGASLLVILNGLRILKSEIRNKKK